MRIGIDARWIFKELSGIGVYTRELIRGLAKLDSRNSYSLFFNDEVLAARTLSETGAKDAANFQCIMLNFGLFSPANQFRLPAILRARQLDIFHSTNYMIPLAAFPAKRPGRIRCVTTIHDLIPLIFPEYAPRSKKRRLFPIYRLLMREIGRRSDVIITDSQCSRMDVISHLHIHEDWTDKVLAIPVGVSPSFSPEMREASKSASKTVLWVGRPDPYKNLIGLVQAFAVVRKSAPFPVRLRVAGSPDPRYPEASRLAESLGVSADIDWLGYVSDEQLLGEYRKADVFVLPSRYEGFGLPVVEAMACGTPVICGNGGSLPEVAGDAAIQVHPDDITGMANAIRSVLSDPALARDMAGHGLRRAANYTWAETARLTLLAYSKALE